jgi:glycosyltransferase involved in cell wall biosynthesis
MRTPIPLHASDVTPGKGKEPGLSILHVAKPTDSGVARCVTDLARDQLARGWRVSVACPESGGLARAVEELGATHLRWEAHRHPGPWLVPEARRLAAIVETSAPDLVHLHSSKAALVGRLVERGRLPTVVQPHAWSFSAVKGPYRSAARAWERFGARWATVVVCVTEGERQVGELAGIEADWRVVPNGVDLGVFSEASDEDRTRARQTLGLEAAHVVVCVGRLQEQKGQDVLLDAWRAVRSRISSAELVLVGDGPLRRRLERRAGAGVRFVGVRDDISAWLAASDVVAVPSRWEVGLPLTALEAMATGRSVVVSDIPGVRDDLGAGGAVVPVEDPTKLAGALVERLTDPARAAAEGREGRRRVEDAHDLRQTTQLMADLYQEVLRTHAVRRAEA